MTSLTLESRQKHRRLPQVDVPIVEDNDELRRFGESIDSGAPKERFVTIEELEHVGLVTTKIQQGFASIDKLFGQQIAAVPSANPTTGAPGGGGGGGGVRTLKALDDTRVDGIAGGQGIVWNGSFFVPTEIPNFKLADATRYDMLFFNGEEWIHTDQELQWNPTDDYLQLANEHSINWLDTVGATQELVNFTSAAAAGASVGHIIKHLDAGVSTTSGTYVDVSGAVVTYAEMEANTDYVVYVRAYMGADGGNTALNGCQLTKGGSLVSGSETLYEPPWGLTIDSNGMMYYWGGVIDSGASGDLQLQIKSGNAGVDTAFANNVSIMMIKVDDLGLGTNVFHDTNTSVIELDADYAGTGAQITIGDGVSDYLVFGSVRVDNFYPASNIIDVQINDGSTQLYGMGHSRADSSDELTLGFMQLWQAPAASTTLNVEAKTSFWSADKVYACIIAIRLDAFVGYQVDFLAQSDPFSGGGGDTDVTTLAFAVGVTDDYCLMACGTGTSGGASDSPDPIIRNDLNGTGDATLAGEIGQDWEINIVAGHQEMPHWVVSSDQSWTAADAVDADFNVTHGTSGSAVWLNNFLIAFSWSIGGSDVDLFDVGNTAYTTRLLGLTNQINNDRPITWLDSDSVAIELAILGASVQTDEFFDDVVNVSTLDNSSQDATEFTSELGGHNFTATVAAGGVAKITSAESKFGTYSIFCDDEAGAMSARWGTTSNSTSFDFAALDWTMECWLLFERKSATDIDIFAKWIWIDSTAETFVFTWSTNGTNTGGGASIAWPVDTYVTGQWYHMAAVRDGNTLKFFVDGVQCATTEDVTGVTFFTADQEFEIFSKESNGSGDHATYMSNARITKGTARYTTGFTPPTAAPPIASSPGEFTLGDPLVTMNLDASAVRFRGATTANYLEIENDDTDINIAGVNLTDINLTGITAINAGTVDADFDALSATHMQFDLLFADGTAEGRLQWNIEDGTLEVGMPGGNVNLQIGQEMLMRVRNTTGAQIDDGSVVTITGASGNKPLIALADATDPILTRVFGIATEDIAHNDNGYVTTRGFVRDIDTDGLGVGNPVFLDDTTPGGYSTTPPVPPNGFFGVGIVIADHATEGVIYCTVTPIPPFGALSDVNLSGLADNEVTSWDSGTSTWLPALINLDNLDTDLEALMEVNIGTALDQPDVSVSSDGAVITFTIEETGTGDIRFMFSDGIHTHDCTDPIASIALTVGTDTSPQINYVYILQSDKLLTKSTAGWPSAEHAPLATILCQSAASAQTDGVYKMHAWTDHNWNEEVGHIAHLNFWIRSQQATWRSGTLCTPSVGAATFDIDVAAGSILQLHPHAFPAFDTSTGSEIMIVNQNGTAYDRVGNMVSQITDSAGVSMSGKYYNLVVWGVVSEDAADCQLMVNLPTASYTTEAAAILDADGTTVYDIPTDFIGTGFLICRLVVRHQVGGNTYSISSNIDLRGATPSTSAGGTVGGGVTSFGDLSDCDDTGASQDDLLVYDGSGTWVDTGGLLTWSGTNLAVTGSIETQLFTITDTAPKLLLIETDAAADEGRWDFVVETEQLRMRIRSDNDDDGRNWLTVSRTLETVVNQIQFTAVSVDMVAALTATSFGGITETNLMDKTADETYSGTMSFTDPGLKPIVLLNNAYIYGKDSGAVDRTLFAIDGSDVVQIGSSGIGTILLRAATDCLGAVTGSSFTADGDVSGVTIGGITEANLVDKTAGEDMSGQWRFIKARDGTYPNLIGFVDIMSTDAQAAGIGGVLSFGGKYTDGGSYTTFGTLRTSKANATSGNYESKMILGARTHGATSQYELSLDGETGDVSAVSFGGITEANLLDKTVAEEVQGAWRFSASNIRQGAADGAANISLGIYENIGFAVRAGTTSGGWARGLVPIKNSDTSRMGGAGFLGSNETITSYHIGFSPSWWAGNDRVEITPTSITIGTDITTLKLNSNHVLEGYATGRNVVRAAGFDIEPGATPGTNIDVTIVPTRGFNSAGLTGATDLAKSGSDGSFTMDAVGKLELAPGQTVIGILGASIGVHDINNSSTSEVYFIDPAIVAGDIQLTVMLRGSVVVQDMTSIMDAGDRMRVIVSYVTST